MSIAHEEYEVVINGTAYKTRHWYMTSKELTVTEKHRKYYGQFCTPSVKNAVALKFKSRLSSVKQALAEGDIHLNGLKLIPFIDEMTKCNKRLVGTLMTKCIYKTVPLNTVYWSLPDNVCIVKEALRQLVEEMPNDQVNDDAC